LFDFFAIQLKSTCLSCKCSIKKTFHLEFASTTSFVTKRVMFKLDFIFYFFISKGTELKFAKKGFVYKKFVPTAGKEGKKAIVKIEKEI
jgi:hypothetical protein